MSLAKIKAELMARAALDKERSTKEIEQLRGRLSDVPLNKIVDQINYLEKQLLPAVLKKKGTDSADYIFFTEVCRSLAWCVIVAERWDYMERRYVNQKIDLALTRERLGLAESELQKYCTMEDLYYTEGLDYILSGIKSRAEGILKRNKI